MPRNNLPQRLLCAAVLAAISLQPSLAEKRSSTSRVRPLSCPEPVAAPEPVSSFTPEMAGDGRVHVFADQVEATLDEWAIFRGHVELLHGELQLRGDEVRYNQTDNTLSAHGQVELSKAGNDTVRAPVLRYELDTERGDSENAEFMLGNNDMGRGWAKRMTMAGRDRMTLESVRYTTCPPGQDDWFLRARELTLDKTSEIGTAWHAVVEFQHVPIFYSPYLSFPLTDERKTGFLTPRMGHGSSSGFMLATPYYFNLAPNYDDTLTPRVLSERGLQLSNEFRYLGESYRGNLELEYLPNDRKTDTDRQALAQHNHRLSPGWSARSDIQWVSDNSYFLDRGNNASVASRTHLPRYLRTDYQGSIWQFTARVSNFQTLDSTITLSDLPYQRLPQLLLRADSPSGPNQLRYTLESEWVNFYRPGFAPDTAGVIEPPVSGQRFDVLPGISLPLRTSYSISHPRPHTATPPGSWAGMRTPITSTPTNHPPADCRFTASTAGWRSNARGESAARPTPRRSNRVSTMSISPTRIRTVCRCSTPPCRTSASSTSSARTGSSAPIAWATPIS
jgi:LPS-assembly protein